MRRKGILACALAGAVALCGCPESTVPAPDDAGVTGDGAVTGDRDGGRVDPTGDIPLEYLTSELAAVYCDRLFECEGTDEELQAIKLLTGSAERCHAFFADVWLDFPDLADFLLRVEEGSVTYDGAAARACVNDMASSCWVVYRYYSPYFMCRGLFRGTVSEGGSCDRSEQCVGDAFCDRESGASCPGTCRARLPLGSECDWQNSDSCASPDGTTLAHCTRYGEEGSYTYECRGQRFEADAYEDRECGFLGGELFEWTERACRPGLWCSEGRGSGEVRCRVPIEAGAPCSGPNEVCVNGYGCIAGSCQEMTVARAAGARCGDGVPTLCDSLSGLQCDGDACAFIGDGSLGARCTPDTYVPEGIPCDPGLQCHEDTMTCEPRAPAGAPCTSSYQCATGACDYSTMTCRARYCGRPSFGA